MSGPYARKPYPFLDQLRNLNINPLTLINGDTIQYNSATTTWENQPLTGGGTANLIGPDNFAVFKSGTNGVSDPQCISRVPGTGGCAMVINGPTFAVGIGVASPNVALDVNGSQRIASGSGASLRVMRFIPASSSVGMLTSVPLVLYSNNALTSPNATRVDGIVNNIQSSSFRSYNPTTFDAPNTTDTNSVYKVKLREGINLWTSGGVFDNQNIFSSANVYFPTEQIVEYQNNKPIQYPKIIGQLTTATNIVFGGNAFVSYFGALVGAEEECIYDPLNMRAFKTGLEWTYWGAPSLYRNATDKFIINVKFFLSGDWSGFDPSDGLIIYIFQYRSGVFFTQHELVITTPNTATTSMRLSGERTLLGFVTGGSEEFIADTDYYAIEIANQSGVNDFNVTRFTIESEFVFAQ